MQVRSILGVVLACSLVTVPLGAQGRGAPPAGGGPRTTPGAQGGGPKGTPHTPQGPKSPNPGTGQASGRPDGAGRPEGAGHGPKAGRPEGAHGPMTVPEHLAAQPQLSQRLQGLLPPGLSVDQAAAGFKNLGQFVAAVHVSKNLGIPFDQLKAQMTGPSAVSLGGAIHTLKPDADASAAVRQAERQARDTTRGPKQ
jgi:hypothetical protein